MEFESEQERLDYEQWLADVAENENRILAAQDELAKQPEFSVLVRTAGISRNPRDLQAVADYAVMQATRLLGTLRK